MKAKTKKQRQDSIRGQPVTLPVPTPDYEGIESWARSYSSDRLSDYYINRDNGNGGSVRFVSGEYPAFSRFVKDIEPALHENGFIISNAVKDKRSWRDDRPETVHVVSGIPMLWAVAYANGYICNRGACRRVRLPGKPTCGSCAGLGDTPGYNIGEPDDLRMIHP